MRLFICAALSIFIFSTTNAQAVEEPFIFLPSNSISALYQEAVSKVIKDQPDALEINTSSYYYDKNTKQILILTLITESPVSYTEQNCKFLYNLYKYPDEEIFRLMEKYWLAKNACILKTKVQFEEGRLAFVIKDLSFSSFKDSADIKKKFAIGSTSFLIPLNEVSVLYKKFQSKKYTVSQMQADKYGIFVSEKKTSAIVTSNPVIDSAEIKANAAGGYCITVFLPLSWVKKQFSALFEVTDEHSSTHLRLMNNKITYTATSVQISSQVEGVVSGRQLQNKYAIEGYFKPGNLVFQRAVVRTTVLNNKPEEILINALVKNSADDLRNKMPILFNKNYPLVFSSQASESKNVWLTMRSCSVTSKYLIITNDISLYQSMH